MFDKLHGIGKDILVVSSALESTWDNSLTKSELAGISLYNPEHYIMLDLKLGNIINMPMNGWLSIMASTKNAQTKLSYLFHCPSTNNNQQPIRRYYRAYNSNTIHVLEFLRKNTDYVLRLSK